MVKALLTSRARDVEDAAFWKSHTMYENFAAENKLPDRLEIQKEADVVGLAMKVEEVAFDEYFFMEPEYSYPMSGFQSAIGRFTAGGCRLLITDLGDLGLGPLSTQHGDVITYIRNAKVPIILRNTQTGNFEVIGDAYIHGFMRGEILKEGPIHFEDIILE